MRREIHRVDILRSWQKARAEFAALRAEHDALREELAATRQTLNELLAANLERMRGFHELRSLQRERDICRARHAERDPAAPLQ